MDIKDTIRQYTINCFIATDQWVNAVLMFGDPDETISSRAGRLWPNSWWTRVINVIFFWQKFHCQSKIETFAGKDDLIHPDPTKLI